MWLFDTIKGRAVAVLVGFLSLSQLLGLWLYIQKSEQAAALLHDALLAEQIALMVRLVERIPAAERERMLEALSGRTVRMAEGLSSALGQSSPEGSRAHDLEHLVAVFLDRPTSEGIRLAYSTDTRVSGIETLLATVRASGHSETHHLPMTPLAEIRPAGAVVAEVSLANASWLRFAAPLLAVSPFSPWKLGAPLVAMLASVLLMAAWILHRWTEPLTHFAAAAERLGTDLHAPPLAERGPVEVRTAARTFNRMQERILRLVEDRTAFAAAIAHDLGTPITRLQLRVHEIDDQETRDRMLADLEQMKRMITATLGFVRSDVSIESSETFDVTSLARSIGDDLVDLGHDVVVQAHSCVAVYSKPIALRRTLSNLVENAIKYGGCARINVAERGENIEIRVEDDGLGVPDHLKEEAFRPFRRLPGPHATTIEGSGLGLTIARSIARALGGNVTLGDTVRGGLRATLILPRRGGEVPVDGREG